MKTVTIYRCHFIQWFISQTKFSHENWTARCRIYFCHLFVKKKTWRKINESSNLLVILFTNFFRSLLNSTDSSGLAFCRCSKNGMRPSKCCRISAPCSFSHAYNTTLIIPRKKFRAFCIFMIENYKNTKSWSTKAMKKWKCKRTTWNS